jgi:hypothetical protein
MWNRAGDSAADPVAGHGRYASERERVSRVAIGLSDAPANCSTALKWGRTPTETSNTISASRYQMMRRESLSRHSRLRDRVRRQTATRKTPKLAVSL